MTGRFKPKHGFEDVSASIKYFPDTGEFYRLRWGRWIKTGYGQPDGYVIVYFKGRNYSAARVAWLLMTGEWPDGEVDHIDINKSNNVWSNLRLATPSQNCANKPTYKQNTSGKKGVHEFINRGVGGRWRARIGVNGKRISLGLFNSPEEAHEAYIAASRKYHKEFSRAE